MFLLVLKRFQIWFPQDMKRLICQRIVEGELSSVSFIPTEAFEGVNLTPLNRGFSDFYDGPCLSDWICSLPSANDEYKSQKELRFHIMRYWRAIRGVGMVWRVKIEQGKIKAGDEFSLPLLKRDQDKYKHKFKVKQVMVAFKIVDEAKAGQVCTLSFDNSWPLMMRSYIWRVRPGGLGIGDGGCVKLVQALIISNEEMKEGETIACFFGTGSLRTLKIRNVLCYMDNKLEKKGNGVVPKNKPSEIVAEVVNKSGLICTTYHNCPAMSRFIFRQENIILGCGHVTQLFEEK